MIDTLDQKKSALDVWELYVGKYTRNRLEQLRNFMYLRYIRPPEKENILEVDQIIRESLYDKTDLQKRRVERTYQRLYQ